VDPLKEGDDDHLRNQPSEQMKKQLNTLLAATGFRLK
jgi:hypothetical protein